MKFVTQPAELKAAVAAMKTAASSKNTMPVLDNILFRPAIDGHALLMTVSNSVSQVTVTLNVTELDAPVPFLIRLSDIASYVANGMGVWPIDVTIMDNGEAVFADEMGETHFPCLLDVAEFPLMQDMGEAKTVLLNPAVLPAIAVASKFVANDELRPQMSCVLVHFNEGKVIAVASDSKRLFKGVVAQPSDVTEELQLLLPDALMTALFSVFNCAVPVHVMYDGKHIVAKQDGREFRTSFTEGRFPRYDAVIPKNNDKVVAISRTGLIAAVKRVCVASNSATHQVAITVTPDGQFTMKADDIDFSKSSCVNLKATKVSNLAAPLTFAVRGDFLTSALNECKSADIYMALSDNTRPILLREAEDSESLILLMPMMLHE